MGLNAIARHLRVAATMGLAVLLACGDAGSGRARAEGSEAGHGPLTKVLDIEGTALLGSPPFEAPVGGALASDGTILIADGSSLSIRVFSQEGRLVRSVGREGSGPGELQSVPWARQCGRDSLFVWDPVAARVSVVSKEGAIARDFRLPGNPALVECSRRGQFAVIMQPKDVRMPDPSGKAPRYRAPLLLVNARGDSVGSLGDVPAYENRPMGKRTRVAVSETAVFLGTQDSAFVHVYAPAGGAIGLLPIGSPGRRTTPEVYASAIEQMSRQLRISTERDAYKAFMLRIPMPELLPPYFELYADGQGGVRALTSLPGEGVTRLEGVAPDGAPLTPWSIEGDVKVFEIGEDYLLGSYEDAGDVPHIVLYKVGKAPT